MGLLEAYLFVAADSFMSGLIFPFHTDVAFPAMRLFGGYNMMLAALCAIIGSTTVIFLNMWLGKLVRMGSQFVYDSERKDNMSKLVYYVGRYGKYGLLFAWIPFAGAIYTIIMGFTGMRIRTIMLWAFAGNVAFYMISAVM